MTNKGLKLMILGLNITLVGGIILLHPNLIWWNIEFHMVYLGLIISCIGFFIE